MGNCLIIGAGGVGRVVAHKCAQIPEVFENVTLAGRTVSKCEAIAADVKRRTGRTIATEHVDAGDTAQLVKLMKRRRPDIVIHVALPYQDLSIMEACLQTGVHYLDTANYEPPDTAHFEYSWQWAYHDRFRQAGLMALLGSGFDPGVTNVFTAWVAKHALDEVRTLDIVDVNAGDHGKPFATNFNPEINIREVTAPCRHYENGIFHRTPPLSRHSRFTCPEGVGTFPVYRMYHEELESLVRNFPTLERAQFWMSFSDNYLKHLEVLQNVGMTRIDPIPFQGTEVVPLQFLKAVLPEPAGLGPDTRGKTCIGTIVGGTRDGEDRSVYVYNLCDHQDAYLEVGSQAVSYTTGVPATLGAKLMLEGTWMSPGVWNLEQFDPYPFMADLNHYGLPWNVQDPAEVSLEDE